MNLENSNKEFLFSCLDQPTNLIKSKGSPIHPSVERGNYNLLPKTSSSSSSSSLSSKSAPTSILPSPAISPRRSYTGDLFVSCLGRHEYQESPPNISPKVPPPKTAHSSQHSPLHSPTARISLSNPRSPNDLPFPLHHKLQKETSVDRSENLNHVAHPLPLPPPLVASSQSHPANVHHVIEKPYVSSMKGQWQKGKLIGRGTFGSVYLATNRCEL